MTKVFVRATGVGDDVGAVLTRQQGVSASQAIRSYSDDLISGLRAVSSDASRSAASRAAASRAVASTRLKAFELVEKAAAGGTTIAQLTDDFLALNAFARNQAFVGRWLTKPLTGPLFSRGSLSILTGSGKRVAWDLLRTYVVKVPNLILGAGALFAAFDILDDLFLTPLYEKTIGRIKRFFQTTSARLFLSPQDDNLFPPHPKDYMQLELDNSIWDPVIRIINGTAAVEGVTGTLSRALT